MNTDESKDWKKIAIAALYCEGLPIRTGPLPSQPVLLKWNDGEHYLGIVYDLSSLVPEDHPDLYLYGGKTRIRLPENWTDNILDHPDIDYLQIPPNMEPTFGTILKRRGFTLNKPAYALPEGLEQKISDLQL